MASLDISQRRAKPCLHVKICAAPVGSAEALKSSVKLQNCVVVEFETVSPCSSLVWCFAPGSKPLDLVLDDHGSVFGNLNKHIPELEPVFRCKRRVVHEVDTWIWMRG